jgi:SAM-dependent methyltransferase
MPIPLHPDEADAFLTTTDAPAPHLDMLTAAAFRTAVAGVRLGVFDALGDGTLDAPALAAKLGTDAAATRVLAEALVATGYLLRGDGGYANSPAAARWLAGDPDGNYGSTLLLWQDLLFELWTDLESSVRTGRPAVDFYAWLAERPAVAARFQQMLASVAGILADEVADLLPADAMGRVLDIGGGHGCFSAAVCRRHPEATATILDPDSAAAHGMLLAEGLTDRITLQPGTWQDHPWQDGGWDSVLLFNVLHGNAPADNAELLARVARALRPGGVVAILDNLADANDWPVDTAFVSVFSLNLLHTQGGRIYDRNEIDGWLAAAGFEPGTWHRSRRMTETHYLIARTPS